MQSTSDDTLPPTRPADAARGRVPALGARVGQSRWTGLLLVLALLGLWELSARFWVDSANWPPFSRVVMALFEEGTGRELFFVFAASLRLMLTGFVIGAGLGIALGVAIGLNRFLREMLSPMVELLRPLPVPGLVPPLILLLGIDAAMKGTVVAFAVLFPVLINTAQGVRAVEPTLLDTARTFRHGRARSILAVILPASLPYIFSGLRISLALALIVTVVAEMIAGGTGIGYYLMTMQYAMRSAEMYAAVVLLAVTGYALNFIIVSVERRVLRWYFAQQD
ncbi:ABC transporter permease subunit [Aquicoccus sp. SCR17]|nr:ABC transporter permease subunit [Carideicomes alvinocaridis]